MPLLLLSGVGRLTQQAGSDGCANEQENRDQGNHKANPVGLDRLAGVPSIRSKACIASTEKLSRKGWSRINGRAGSPTSGLSRQVICELTKAYRKTQASRRVRQARRPRSAPSRATGSTMNLNEIEDLGEMLLSKTAYPVPRFRIIRDILKLSPHNPLYIHAKAGMLKSRWAAEVQHSQHPDGTWGRFHSRDSSIRCKFPTTELAVSRALALGLDRESETLRRAAAFMLRVLECRADWSDPPEKHEGWPINILFITAGTLAKIDAHHPALQVSSEIWVEIVKRSFRSGAYCAEDERAAHRELNKIITKNKYLKLASLYPLLLLSSARSPLPENTERLFLDWLWNKEGGIYYIYDGCLSRFPETSVRGVPFWVEAMEVLSRFCSWRSFTQAAVEWIWRQRDLQGLWDFGANARASIYFPLSDTWRNPIDRKIDCSIRILALLRKYAEDQPPVRL